LFFFVFGGVFEGAAWHSHRQVDRVGLLGVPRDVVDSWFLNAFSIFDPHVSAQAAFASRSEEANGTRRGHMNTSYIRVLANMLICCYCSFMFAYWNALEKTLGLVCEALEKVVGAQSKPHLQRHVLL